MHILAFSLHEIGYIYSTYITQAVSIMVINPQTCGEIIGLAVMILLNAHVTKSTMTSGRFNTPITQVTVLICISILKKNMHETEKSMTLRLIK